mmetsp:Transcript_28229/g.31633  ORF Transcript_28229/g.31633 Transcript_28229/m.31633 type:complete len:245 (-) Transcript_28229:65-799(-)
MGKKSKQHKSNKVPTCCYHGCTKKEFNNCGEHYKVIEDWVRLDLLDDAETHSKECEKFYEKNQRVLGIPTFDRFLVAHIADDYLKGKTAAYLRSRLFLLVQIRHFPITAIMTNVNKDSRDLRIEKGAMTNFNKYSRDVHTERGRINLMAREIPCDCLEEKRKAAKSLAKVAMCYFCWQEYPKQTMLRCKGCELEQYCSQECSIKAWPEHKVYCYKNGISSAPAPSLGSVSSVEEPSDVDVDGEE